jgi:hypothetical protein
MKWMVLILTLLTFAFIDLMLCMGIGLLLGGDAGGMLGFIVATIFAAIGGYYGEPLMSEFVR